MWAYSFTNNVIFENIIVFHKFINIFAKEAVRKGIRPPN